LKKRKIKFTILFLISILFFLSSFNNNFCNASFFKSSDDNILDHFKHRIDNNNFFEQSTVLNVGGLGKSNYTIIQDAINDSKDGDIVFVWEYSSPYHENILIDKRINLIGQNKNKTVIDGGGLIDVITVMVDNVLICGFTIINSGTDWIDAGIKLHSDNNIIKGNIISNNNFGIYSYNLENSVISDNIINHNFNSGIHLPFSNNVSIINNKIMNNILKGIFLYDSNVHCNNRNKIEENIIKNNNFGIYFWFSYRTDISRNIISCNCNGISFNHNSEYNNINNNTITDNLFDGIFLNSSCFNQIINNEITRNINGMNFKYSSYCDIINNRIIGYNDIGFLSNYSSNNFLNGNYFSNNNIYGIALNHSSKSYIGYNYIIHNEDIGLYLNQNSNDNIIVYNDFINQFPHSFFMNCFRNKWTNNYWDDWNKNGFYKIYGKMNLLNGFLSLNWFNYDLKPSENEKL